MIATQRIDRGDAGRRPALGVHPAGASRAAGCIFLRHRGTCDWRTADLPERNHHRRSRYPCCRDRFQSFLLLRSGIGPAAELAGLGVECHIDLSGVGRNLAEHPCVPVQLRVTMSADGPVFQTVLTWHSTEASSSCPPDLRIFAQGRFINEEGRRRFVVRGARETAFPRARDAAFS